MAKSGDIQNMKIEKSSTLIFILWAIEVNFGKFLLKNLFLEGDTSYVGSLLWRNDVFFLGTLYSNAYGD